MERNSVICVRVCVFPGVACCCTVGGLAGFGLLFVFPVSHALKEFLIPQEFIHFPKKLKARASFLLQHPQHSAKDRCRLKAFSVKAQTKVLYSFI